MLEINVYVYTKFQVMQMQKISATEKDISHQMFKSFAMQI